MASTQCSDPYALSAEFYDVLSEQQWLKRRGGDLMHWTLDYQVLAGDNVVRHFSAEHDWHTFGLEQIAEEAGVAGFALEPLGDALIPAAVLRRRPRS